MEDAQQTGEVGEFIEWLAEVLVDRFKKYNETPKWRCVKRHHLKMTITTMYSVGKHMLEELGAEPEIILTVTTRPKWLR